MAVPRTSVQPPATEARQPREGLSLQTLIIAAIASGVAAVIVSHFWSRGTILASAMTPVIVAVISELLKKPVESERLRGSVRAASSVARPRSGRTPRVIAPPPAGVDEGLKQRDDGVDPGPVRVYSSGSSKRPGAAGDTAPRRRRMRIAVITGLVAFLVAALALTLPELIFGGSVGGGGGNTTYFGGGQSTEEKGQSQDGESGDDGSSPSGPGDGGQQAPGSTAPDGEQPSQDPGGETTTPETDPATPPSQAPPPQTSPSSPSTPAPSPQPPGP